MTWALRTPWWQKTTIWRLLVLRLFGQAFELELGQAADGGGGDAVVVNGGALQLVGLAHVQPDKVFVAVELALDVVDGQLGRTKRVWHGG